MPTKRDKDAPYWRWIKQYKQYIVRGALHKTEGNVTQAAINLGISRQGLMKEMASLAAAGLPVRDEDVVEPETAVPAEIAPTDGPEPVAEAETPPEEAPDAHHAREE